MPKEFKSGLDQILKEIAADVDLGESFTRGFDANWFKDYDRDPELYDPLFSLFKRSKLDPKWPGHWQFLLLAVANEIYSKRTGRDTFWDAGREEELFRLVLKQRKKDREEGRRVSVQNICKQPVFKQSFKNITAETLHARFNIVLKRKRGMAKSEDASSALNKNISWFSSK